MELSQTVTGVSVTKLAAEVGVSRRTLFRWIKQGVPGREPKKKLWADRLEKAASKLRPKGA